MSPLTVVPVTSPLVVEKLEGGCEITLVGVVLSVAVQVHACGAVESEDVTIVHVPDEPLAT